MAYLTYNGKYLMHNGKYVTAHDTRFKITVDTTKAGSANDTFVLPTYTSGTYDYYVDWGDEGAEEHITTTGNHTHIYAASGTYQIKIRGTFPGIYFNNEGDKLKLMTIDNWGSVKWISMAYAFSGCTNMQGTYKDAPNLSSVENMGSMFKSCAAFNQSVANFDTSSVKSMNNMFYCCGAFNQSVANFDTSKVTDMGSMFQNCWAFNQSVSNFDTSSVTNMHYMFANCAAFKQSLAAFNIEDVTNIADICFGINLNATGTTTNYDATLVSWAAQTVHASLNFNGGTSKYSVAGGGTDARATLTGEPNNWVITDGGQA